MFKYLPYYFALFVIAPLWATPKVGGDIPVRLPEEIQHAPVPADTVSTHRSITPPSPWDSFVGYFRIGLEQAPIQSFQAVKYEWVSVYNADDYISLNVRTKHRPPFLLTLTPFEPFGKSDSTHSFGPSLWQELYSFTFGFGVIPEPTFNFEHQVLFPVYRSGLTQIDLGGYLSTYLFRNGNPYWSTGLMGYAGYLVTHNVMVRVGLKHMMYDYLKSEKDVLRPNDDQEDVEDLPTQYFVKPNAWRMFVSLSIGSI